MNGEHLDEKHIDEVSCSDFSEYTAKQIQWLILQELDEIRKELRGMHGDTPQGWTLEATG